MNLHNGVSMNNILLSGPDIDGEEAAFYHWLSGSKEWIERYGINALVEMMMKEFYDEEPFDVA